LRLRLRRRDKILRLAIARGAGAFGFIIRAFKRFDALA
jgi:hypothetical protein